MVVKTLFKTILREIKHNLGRFLSIFSITALGVGFLAGLLSTVPDFHNTIDSYYDNTNFMDFRIKSTVGFTTDDVRALKRIKFIDKITPIKSCDVVMNYNTVDSVGRITGIDFDSYKTNKSVNELKLINGRWPEKSNECIISKANIIKSNPKLNTTYTLTDKNNIINTHELTVVGIVESPEYMSIEKESSNVGIGKIEYIVYTGNDIFNTSYYTDVYLTAKDIRALNTFDDDYKTQSKTIKKDIEKIAHERENKRFEELKTIATETALSTQQGKYYQSIGKTDEFLKEAIKKINKPEWYILDRNTNVSFVSLKSNVEKINSIAKVFPIFFFLVASLVALTTMTRMVDEQRTEIGILKSLGYSNLSITLKYILYSGIAALTGGVAGLAVGLYILPTVIINVYKIMYRIPDILISFNPTVSLIALAAAIFCIMVSTLSAVMSNLNEVSANLLLPKAPKTGKRILLERVGFIWKRLKFTHKVTARNIFRYKKRFLMTVIGVSGCTALLLTGFGLKDAIGDIVPKQYKEIQKYDLTIEKSDIQNKNADEYIKDNFKNYLYMHYETGNIILNNEESEINISVPSDTKKFKDFIDLRERKNSKKILFNDDSVILTEKFASVNKIKKGDTISLKTSKGNKASLKVTDICENYINSYIYLSPESFKKYIGEDFLYTTVLVKSNEKNPDEKMKQMLNVDGIASASFSSTIITSFKNMISRIDYIVIVLIISAGLLAFVVLYNLTNINISERKKEIATIKVLGFYDKEVNSYICRESYILSIIGTALGLVLGIFLCRFVVLTAEIDMAMFGRNIYLHSYIYSAVITLIFSVIVNFFMYFKLKSIGMSDQM